MVDDVQFSREVAGRVSLIADLTVAISAWAHAHGVPERVTRRAALVLDELFTNIVKHGYRENPQGTVLVEARVDHASVRVRLTDHAPPFNPLLVPLPDTSLPLEQREIGGLGLLFVRRTADALEYRLLETQGSPPRNQVCFVQRLAPAGAPTPSA